MALNELAVLNAIQVLEEVAMEAEQPPRRFHLRADPFKLPEKHFIRLFRLTKDLTRFLIDIVRPYIPNICFKCTKVLIGLRFFATGSYHMDSATNIYLAVNQSSVSRAINATIEVLNIPQIFNEYVRFPRNLQEMNVIRNEFYRQYGFSGVIGCLDCTHVAIVPPKNGHPLYLEDIYVNRKHYHSLNVQLVSSSHDSFIWNASNVKQLMEDLHRNGHNAYYLLADSEYGSRPWLLTPLEEEPAVCTPEEAYNIAHKATGNAIERCNGVLKLRFRCLLKYRILHYAPNIASKTVNSCVVLHNLCIQNNVPDAEPEDVAQDIDYGLLVNDDNINNPGEVRVHPDLVEARRVQRCLIRNYFI